MLRKNFHFRVKEEISLALSGSDCLRCVVNTVFHSCKSLFTTFDFLISGVGTGTSSW